MIRNGDNVEAHQVIILFLSSWGMLIPVFSVGQRNFELAEDR